jgi:hypothetical protein
MEGDSQFKRHADDYPRSMSDQGVRERRSKMLDVPHMRSLRELTEQLRQRGLGKVPDFDPIDGGPEAQVLFLFEKPGPMTVDEGRGRRPGSAFISRNNDDPTAAATFKFMEQAGLLPGQIAIWNIIPWWNGTTEVHPKEVNLGLEYLDELVSRLPKLCVAMLVGQSAANAERVLRKQGLTVMRSDHPSPLVRARWPARWNAIYKIWARAKDFIDSSGRRAGLLEEA